MSEKVKLGEIIDTIQGNQYPLEEQILEEKDGYYRFLRISDFTKTDEPIRYVKYSGKELICEEDEVVVVRYGNVGFIGYGKKGILANNLFVLRMKSNDFISKYIYYFLKSPRINQCIINKANSSTMPALTHKMIKELEIPLIKIEEQKNIVAILRKIERIIDIRREQIKELDELIKSQFVEMFDGIENKIRLGDCCEVYARIGWQALTKSEHLENGDYMLITGTDFKNNEINYETCVYVTKERYEMDKHIILKNNDILITKDGTIGKVAIVHNLNKPATLNSGIFVIRPDSRFNKEYIAYVFKGPLFEDFVNKSKTGATIKHLNQKHLVEFAIPLPAIELQNEFANLYKLIDKQKFEIEKSLKEMQELYESLMDKYFG